MSVCIQIRPDLLSGLIWVQTVCIGYLVDKELHVSKAFTNLVLNNKKSYGIYIPTVLGIFMGLWLLKGTKGSMFKSYSILSDFIIKAK